MARKKEKTRLTLIVEFDEAYDDSARDIVYTAEGTGGVILKAEFYQPAAPAKTVNLLSD